jgi:DNA-binding beta-propeller fold protein YncE
MCALKKPARKTASAAFLLLALAMPAALLGAGNRTPAKTALAVPVITMDGGRRLEFVRAFSSEKELNPNRSFWKRAVDFVAGAPDYGRLIRPYGITTDSRGRIIITDPGAMTVHIFDFEKKKYRRLERGKGQYFLSPIGVAVDAQDNIYVTDSLSGRIFVFDAEGKFRRFIGSLAKNEGFFKRATGIAIDKQKGELFVTDTLRDKIFVMDLQGNVLREFGGRGSGPGEFNYPTELVLHGNELYVVDAMNFRVQILDRQGRFQAQFGKVGNSVGTLSRPKGMSVDSEGNIYLVDALLETVQVFSRDGTLLYVFGRTGGGPGELQLPSGLWIDANDRVYLADSYNQRVQVFQFTSANRAAGGRH